MTGVGDWGLEESAVCDHHAASRSIPEIDFRARRLPNELSAYVSFESMDDRVLGRYDLVGRVKTNLPFGGERSTTRPNESCVAVQLKGYSADHRGGGTNYQCSEVLWITDVALRHCPRREG
jgi:hypothetical protein